MQNYQTPEDDNINSKNEFNPNRILSEIKIMRDRERKTADGQKRSLGYQFLEFHDHNLQLNVLKTV